MGLEPDDEMVFAYSAINDGMWKKLERGEITKEALRFARFAEFCAAYNWNFDVEKMSLTYTGFLSEKVFLIDGALETCRRLAAHASLYIITNGIKFVQERRFGASPLVPYFKDVFISEEMGAEKPHKAYFDEVARRIPDFAPQETLVVGDSLSSDIQGGINAGLDTCWLNRSGKPVPAEMPITYIIERLEELIPLILGD
jgi:2-haloacid dehalogenase